MKKLLIGLVALVAIFLIAIVVTPMVYDVDAKLRPIIEKEAAKNLNGSLKIGKMTLNLLKGINIQIDGIDLQATGENDSILKAETASMDIPFGSLLGGELQVDLNIIRPVIRVIKDKKGKFNFEKIMKEKLKGAANDSQASQEKAGDTADLSILNKVDLDINIQDAIIVNKDLQTNFDTRVENYNLSLENLGFGKDIDLKASAKIDVQPSKDISLKGVVKIEGKANVDWGDKGFQGLLAELEVDLSATKAVVAGIVNKAQGVPLKLDLTAKMDSNSIQVEELDFVVNDLRLRTTGKLSSFDPIKYDFKLNSSLIRMEDWRGILVPLGQYQVAGGLSLDVQVSGDDKSLNYGGNIQLTEGEANIPGFKHPLNSIRVNINLENEKVKIKDVSALVGSSSISMNGSLQNFDSPVVSLGIYSSNLSVNDFLADMTDEEKRAKVEAAKQDQPELSEEQIQKMVMGPIEQLKQIPMLRKLRLNANIKVDQLFYENISASNFVSDISYSNLVMRLSKARMDVFNGKVALVSSVDIRGAKPRYSVKAKTAKLDSVAFTEAFMASMKGTITGLMDADFSVSGQGASKADIKQHLKGAGSFKLEEGSWSGLKAMKIIGEKLASIKGAREAAEKVRIGNTFKEFKGDFSIASGKFNLNNLIMDLTEARMAILGRGTVDFDMNTNMLASIIAPLDNPPQKIRYRDGRAELPVEITGKITSPKIGWEKMLRKVAGAYVEVKAKKEVKKAVDKEVQKLLKSKKSKDLLKKLGF